MNAQVFSCKNRRTKNIGFLSKIFILLKIDLYPKLNSTLGNLELHFFVTFFPIKPNPKPPLTSSIPSSKKASSNLPKLISPKNPPTKLGVYPLKAKITQSTTFTTTFTIQPSLNTFSPNTRPATKMKSPKKSKTNFISLTTTICNTLIL